MIARHRLVAYVVLAYSISWSWWVPLALTATHTRAGLGWPTHLPGLMGAALAAIIVTAAVSGREGLRNLAARTFRWRIPARWYAVVAATAGLLVLAPLTRALAGESLPGLDDYVTYSGLAVLPAFLAVAIVLVVNGFGEEIGWRGFLVDGLLPRHGVVRTGLIVAPVWALWHLPLFWVVADFVDLGAVGAIGWFVGLTAGSLVLTWLYLSSGRSIAIVALWHAAFNFATATTAGTGAPAAVASTLVMVAAVVMVVMIPRRERAAHRSALTA